MSATTKEGVRAGLKDGFTADTPAGAVTTSSPAMTMANPITRLAHALRDIRGT